MTEYDYSVEGYRRHLETQNRISRWVDDTSVHSRGFKPPFGARSDVPSEVSRSLNSSPAPSAARSVPRPHEYHGTTSRSGSGSRSSSGSGYTDREMRRRSVAHPSPLGMGNDAIPGYDVPRSLGGAQPQLNPLPAPIPRTHSHLPPFPSTAPVPQHIPTHSIPPSHHASFPRTHEMDRRTHSSSPRPKSVVSRALSPSGYSRHDTQSRHSHSLEPLYHNATHTPSRSHTLPASMHMRSSSLSRSHHPSDEFRSPDYESRSRSHRDSHHSHHSSSSSHKHHRPRSRSLSVSSGATYTIAAPTYVSPHSNNSAAPLIVPFAKSADRKTYVASLPPGTTSGLTIIPPKGKTVKVIL
ncbi:hypothetical protein VNI00_015815 [Paramarasmius palmivorus]|uniref:Uncharacterized protein n=1 Tax=Paramarasmius palmivorus TaxID=297713 RepID=A0AAW0BL09_9AGAR